MGHHTETAFGWIHTYEDYLNMFKLSDLDLNKRIIVYPADISNFAQIMNKNNNKVICLDEKYNYSLEEIRAYGNQRQIQLKEKLNHFHNIHNKKQLCEKWEKVTQQFIDDYESGQTEGRYQFCEWNKLPEHNTIFELALCPRCPFQHSQGDHQRPLELIHQLCQIAQQVRIFINISDHLSIEASLGPMMVILQQNNYGIQLHETNVNSPNPSTAMLEIWSRECQVKKVIK